jgi:hypothetical protein
MPTTPVPTLVSRGTMLEELDRLELGPDPTSAWDDAWLVGESARLSLRRQASPAQGAIGSATSRS